MVILHVKKGDESQFLFQAHVQDKVDDVVISVTTIYNGRLKISRICSEMEELIKHGTLFPPEILGLTEEQVEELKLKDEWGEKCEPMGGWTFNKDPIGRRNGKQPSERMQEVMNKAIEDVKARVSKKKVDVGVCISLKEIQECLDILRGAVTIAYPMNLPPHDVIRMEFENTEDLSGTQASLEVIDMALAQLWFSGKEMHRSKKLCDIVGTNDKLKLIVKLSSAGHGAPGREPVFSEEERKKMMADAFRRQEELKKLEQDDDYEYYNAPWADSGSLKRSFQGMSNISWKPK